MQDDLAVHSDSRKQLAGQSYTCGLENCHAAARLRALTWAAVSALSCLAVQSDCLCHLHCQIVCDK